MDNSSIFFTSNLELMRKVIIVIVALIGIFFSTATFASISNASNADTQSETQKPQLNIETLKDLSTKEIEAEIGHKLTLKQKIAIKILKLKSLKSEKYDAESDSNSNTGIGWLLGLLFGIIGVLITYIAFGKEKDTISAAWRGFLLGVIIILLIALL